mmetsp:Transcript_34142/g.60957  ORF Transcript_34142/g.60957 Transcript_34142/m.60957 type:complete len:202 (+) Transcript_34142:293-898(+)
MPTVSHRFSSPCGSARLGALDPGEIRGGGPPSAGDWSPEISPPIAPRLCWTESSTLRASSTGSPRISSITIASSRLSRALLSVPASCFSCLFTRSSCSMTRSRSSVEEGSRRMRFSCVCRLPSYGTLPAVLIRSSVSSAKLPARLTARSAEDPPPFPPPSLLLPPASPIVMGRPLPARLIVLRVNPSSWAATRLNLEFGVE